MIDKEISNHVVIRFLLRRKSLVDICDNRPAKIFLYFQFKLKLINRQLKKITYMKLAETLLSLIIFNFFLNFILIILILMSVNKNIF